MGPNPSDTIPEFIQERLQEADEPELRAVAAFALEDGPVGPVPDRIAEALALQEDAVVEAVGEYAAALADRKGGGQDGDVSSGYYELIERIVDHEADVLGREEAVRLARSVDGLEVGPDGTVVALTREEVAVVGDLVDVYVGKLGDSAAVALQGVAREFRDDLALPDSLR